MKKIILIVTLFLCFVGLIAQEAHLDSLKTGLVTHLSAQNVYVRFNNTKDITVGDTIFLLNEDGRFPALIVEYKSSISVSGKPFPNVKLLPDTKLTIKVIPTSPIVNKAQIKTAKKTILPVLGEDAIASKDNLTNIQSNKGSAAEDRMQKINGRLSISNYSGLSNTSDNSHRFRYTASVNAQNISNSQFSFETYLSFSHRAGEWNEVKADPFSALKIYSLAASSEFGNHTKVWAGRKINPKISNIGAVDGIQTETAFKDFSFGGVVGARPDYRNYSFNPSLFEYGGYVAHTMKNSSGRMQNSAAFFEQKNTGLTDRRFAYFQHDNSLLKNVYLFVSGEIDLYKIQEGIISNKPSFTSLYISTRYRVNRKFSIYSSYDARKNVIYYETFKDYAARLLEEATRQGFQIKLNYRPTNYIFMGLSGGYRVRDKDTRANENIRSFITFSRIPVINSSLTASVNLLRTSYLDGMVLSLRLSKDLIPGKLITNINYRYVDYTFSNSGSLLKQHNIQTNLSYQFNKLTSCSLDYEFTFHETFLYHRIYINFVQRFKK